MFHTGANIAMFTGVTIRSVFPSPPRKRRHPGVDGLAVARAFLTAVSAVSERASGVCAEFAFRRPPRFGATRRELAILDSGARSWVRGPSGEIAMWRWGDGPRILLAHGWGSHAGRLTSFVPRLVAAGLSVTAFDAPGHGDSPGRFSSLPEFVDGLTRVARAVRPEGVIGHSLGAAAAALAIHAGMPARAAVLIAPPADPGAYTRRFAQWLGLTPAAAEVMRRRLERRYASTIDDYRLLERSPRIPTLILHDRGDTRVAVSNGRALAAAWPRAQFVETRGLGHHRILRSPAVLRRASRFLAANLLAPRPRVARFLKPSMVVPSRAIGG
ncbi:MAG TPA: alpha/beta fold hydrolase [Thermoanaerobaculia bacterium]|nr:alpha/beta fold hydrolase [Thermoanaerobaculia bacterium]